MPYYLFSHTYGYIVEIGSSASPSTSTGSPLRCYKLEGLNLECGDDGRIRRNINEREKEGKRIQNINNNIIMCSRDNNSSSSSGSRERKRDVRGREIKRDNSDNDNNLDDNIDDDEGKEKPAITPSQNHTDLSHLHGIGKSVLNRRSSLTSQYVNPSVNVYPVINRNGPSSPSWGKSSPSNIYNETADFIEEKDAVRFNDSINHLDILNIHLINVGTDQLLHIIFNTPLLDSYKVDDSANNNLLCLKNTKYGGLSLSLSLSFFLSFFFYLSLSFSLSL